MSEAFSFRLLPKTSWDENIKEQSILSLIWATAPRTSVGVTATNEAKTHRPGFVKLIAGGFSDSVMLSRAQTHDRTFDVSLATALHNFVVAPARWASREIHRRLRKKSSGSTGEKHRKSKQAYPTRKMALEVGGEMQEMILSGYIDGLFGYAMVLTRNPAEAADLVQETYVRALKAKESLRPNSNVKSWLFTILRNIWLNQLRHARTAPQIVELEAHEGIADVAIETSKDPYAQYVSEMEQEKVRNAIQQLPEEFREIIILREYEELSYQEIAAMLDCPAGTVMSRLARARSRLRLLLSANEQSFQGTERWKAKRYSQET